MKDIKKKIIYAVLVAGLFLSPLLMPSNGKEYAAVACCLFVILCFIFKVQSVIKTVIPVIIFSVLAPMAILIVIAQPISKTWIGATNYFFEHFNTSILLSFFSPVALSTILHFGLTRLSMFRKDRQYKRNGT